MASITISDLRPAGTDLFQDSESFLHELTEQEVGDVLGGSRPFWFTFICFGRESRYTDSSPNLSSAETLSDINALP